MALTRLPPALNRFPRTRVGGGRPLPWEPDSALVGGTESAGGFLGGVQNLSTANHWVGAAGQGSGAVTSITYAILFRYDANTDADRSVFARFNSSTGWVTYAKRSGANGGLACFGGANRFGNFGSLTTGKTYFSVGTVTSGSVIKSYVNVSGVITLQDTQTAGTFSAANASAPMCIGCVDISGVKSQGAVGTTVIGCSAVTGEMALADIAIWFAAIQAANRFVLPPSGGTINHFDARDASESWVDSVGGVSLTRAGTPTTGLVVVPDWG